MLKRAKRVNLTKQNKIKLNATIKKTEDKSKITKTIFRLITLDLDWEHGASIYRNIMYTKYLFV